MDIIVKTIIDAAYPPATLPDGVQGVLGYIGGRKATHIWTPAGWAPFSHVAQIPIYGPDLTADPVAQADDAVAAAKALGWAPWMRGNGERVIEFDLETGVDASWWARAETTVSLAGFVAVCYGSMSTVFGNRASYVHGADWDDIPQIPAGQTLVGCQYEANSSFGGTEVDYSVVDEWLFLRAGVGPRHT
jgi:hypothetical protein